MSAAQHLPLALLIVGGCYYIPKGSDDSSLRDSGSQVESTWYADDDGDGYGRDDDVLRSTTQPEGYAAVGGDCDDNSADRNPGEIDVCNDGEDQDCDGEDVACPEARRTGSMELAELVAAQLITNYATEVEGSHVGISVSGLSGVMLGGKQTFAVGATGAGGDGHGLVYLLTKTNDTNVTLNDEQGAAVSSPVEAALASGSPGTQLGSMIVEFDDLLVIGSANKDGGVCVWSKTNITKGNILTEDDAEYCIAGDTGAKVGSWEFPGSAQFGDDLAIASTGEGASGSVFVLDHNALTAGTFSSTPLVTNTTYATEIVSSDGLAGFGASLATLDCPLDGQRLLVGAPDSDTLTVFDESFQLVALIEEGDSSYRAEFGATIAIMPVEVSEPTEVLVFVGSPGHEVVSVLSAESICALDNATTPTDPASIATAYYQTKDKPDRTTGNRFGRTIAPLGDVDGDGLNDIAIGAKGRLYVVYGGGGDKVNVSSEVSTAFWQICQIDCDSGDASSAFPNAIVGPGDIDGDGLADILFGFDQLDDAEGAAYLIRSSN